IEFIEAPAFTRHLPDYLTDDDYRELQAKLGASPELGDLMPGTGLVSKVALGRRAAWQRPQRRVTHYLLPLQTLYDKKRSFRADGEREESTKRFDRKRISSTSASASNRINQVGEDTVMAKRDLFGELMEGV